MSPRYTKTVKRCAWIAVALVVGFVLYALSLGPVLRLFDTTHAPEGYHSLPAAVRLFYYPLQHVPWPAIYQRYVITTTLPPRKPYVPTEAERAAWPKTLDEAVTCILGEMDDADKARVRDMKKEDLAQFYHGWGTGIRNEFGLWKGNTNLFINF